MRGIRAGHLARAAWLCAALAACAKSADVDGSDGGSSAPSRLGAAAQGLTKTDKIDLLLDVDNSRSMSDKQQVLNESIPFLVDRLVNPICVAGDGSPSFTQPKGPLDPCPAGTTREFTPILDIHIGVVDSSLGGHGSDACADAFMDAEDCANDAINTSNNDHGHLITRKGPCEGGSVATYQSLGFLQWDPTKKVSPPGTSDLAELHQTVTDLVTGLGQIGCAFESQQEGWLRFLVDPNPYQSISPPPPGTGNVVKTGTDQALLAQRADFLRPDSLLLVIVLSDENDGSVIEGGQHYVVEQLSSSMGAYHLPPPRSECKTNPADPCCKSCGQPIDACPPDPACTPALDNLSDSTNLRMYDNKRRFGIDFLYPWQRYVNALTIANIDPTHDDLLPDDPNHGTPNPVFSNLSKDSSAPVRGAELVLMVGIVGVPWQDLAKDPAHPAKGYKTPGEMAIPDANGHTTWDYIVGDPDTYRPPLDPFMLEQIDPRPAGAKNPFSGDAIIAPGAPGFNAINGHEQNVPQRDDLQYACVFDIPVPHDCATAVSCDCIDVPNADNPLCAPNPNDGMKPTLQVRAKGYPGIRHLRILEGMGDRGTAASICPPQMTDTNRADYAYRNPIASVLEQIKPRIQ